MVSDVMQSFRQTGNIAYIVLCHDEPELLKRVASVLNYGGDKLFVHVDKKVDIAPFELIAKECPNVVLLENRREVYWGGFSSIEATMALFRVVLNDDVSNFDRIVLLQGKDYPLHSPQYIHAFFDLRKTEEFCKAKNISKSTNSRDYMKCCGYWNMDGRKNIIRKVTRRFFSLLNVKLKIKYRKSYFNLLGSRWDIYKGWAQVSLTRACAEYVLKVYDDVPQYNNYMRHRFPPDEIYIHTILYNSPFQDNISDYSLTPRNGAEWFSEQLNLTYFEYPVTVTVFKNADDYKDLLATNALFFRKATYSDSVKLLDEIDKNIYLEDFHGEKT